MTNTDPRIDAYIGKSAAFAKPILTHIRKLVHQACPQVEETMKWSFPHFMYKGIVCSMASFKEHCSFGFWKASLILGRGRAGSNTEAGGMGQFGRIRCLSDLPSEKVLRDYIQRAVQLNEQGIKPPTKPRAKGPNALIVPQYFKAALNKNRKALATFEQFSYSHKKEYVEWITEAKGEETRQRRLNDALIWMAQGKPRNWKYLNC